MSFLHFNEEQEEHKHIQITCENIVINLDTIKPRIYKMHVELVSPEKKYSMNELSLIMEREMSAVMKKLPEVFLQNNLILIENLDYLQYYVYRAVTFHHEICHCAVAKKRPKTDACEEMYVVEYESCLNPKFKENEIFDIDGNLIVLAAPIITYS